MVPCGQIVANYATNYTVSCCESQSKQHHFPSMNQTELIQPMSMSTPMLCTSPFYDTPTVQSVHPRATLIPLVLISFMTSPPLQCVTLYSWFILGTRDPALQPPDSCQSQNPQPILVRSALAALNMEPLSCCKRFNEFLLQSLHNTLGLKDQSSLACYFPGLFVDHSL